VLLAAKKSRTPQRHPSIVESVNAIQNNKWLSQTEKRVRI